MKGSVQIIAVLCGESFNVTQPISSRSGAPGDATLPAAQTGPLTTRTSDTAGVITLGAGHGRQVNDLVDLYFGANGVQYGAKISAVDATTITFSLGAGTVLPIATTPINVGLQVPISLRCDGTTMQALVANSARVSHLDFQNAANASLNFNGSPGLLLQPNSPYLWLGQGTPPLPAAVDHVCASCGDPLGSALIKIAAPWGPAA